AWFGEAQDMHAEDIEINKAMGKNGAALIADGDAVMTHCNAGALATAGYGTALGVIRAAFEQGKRIRVIANETRPFLQGARLTAYELAKEGIPVTVACDNAVGHLMKKGMVQKVVVGADRIAANGDAANKIGTYTVALAAKAHGVPFYVAAPASTFDLTLPSGDLIPIEDRTPREVTHVGEHRITPENVPVYNFAFDVTPAELIAGIITEKGVLTAPYVDSIRAAIGGK
ncbi:S-methyl-5-thioribose-1-phosphate isomerase, partial [Solidesulfovibrio sp.]|uniref:S-methyl-5-thioribose-1-phosphate isomerase n=1 Tax=Solidesulfovibrio sp. TaxID=2910990 RepID=UPI002B1F5B1A